MSLWTSTDAAAATGGVTGEWEATGVSIDTRTLLPGDLFVALKAARDGHDFVAQALDKGAAAALVSHVPDGVDPARCLKVNDVQQALEDLGKAARARGRARIAAITGSVGKTSTKEMLRDVLSPQGKTHVAEASYNNHWGVPLTLARMPADADFAVLEIGMNAPGEIAPLARLARPHVAMITAIAPAHLEAFESLAAIAEEKASIVQGLEPGGSAVLNADTDHADILTARAGGAGARIVQFGTGAAYPLKTLSLQGDKTIVETEIDGEPVLLKLNSAGRHFGMNALGVIATAQALGADPFEAARLIGTWQPPAGRGTREVLDLDPADPALSIELIDDAFNANPSSMAAAFEVLAAAQPTDDVGRVLRGRRVAILGDMLELGPTEAAQHAALSSNIHLALASKVHCVGPRMQHLHDALAPGQRGRWFETAEAAASEAHHLLDAGDVVLVKGSKGSQVSRVVDAIRRLGHPRPQE
ncbi:MAG: UDP-N-acetylmuramoyl-tripeptide--D-alanyl-D-alanine ligase [Pseudomonadota bacterium]